MPSGTNKIKVAFSVTNCICFDQRVLKIADTVSTLGCEIIIIGRKKGQCCSHNTVPFRTKRFTMFFKRGFLFYSFFNIRLFVYLILNKFDVLVANDLDTLLPNFLAAKIKHIPLVYDSHEYFTEVPEIRNRTFVKWFWQTIEKVTFPRVKYVMTVSEPISFTYWQLYKIRPVVIMNVSMRSDNFSKFSREELGIRKDDLLLIIQGNGINIDKGAEELISAVEITSGVSLIVIGSGDVVPGLKRMVKNSNLGERVKFIPAVSWEKLMEYTKSADIGMCLEKDTNLNYRYCLPNKLFDYISAGIPVIASDLPETGKIIKENGFGFIIESVTPENISLAIKKIQKDPEEHAELKQNAIAASKQLNWEKESKKVLEFYKRVFDEKV